MSTHIDAPKGAIADVVLLPGDPLRAQYIAEHFWKRLSATIQCVMPLVIRAPLKGDGSQFKRRGWGFLQFQFMLMNLFRIMALKH